MDSQPPAGKADPSIKTLALKAILVVDDDQQLASALQWILADENFLVDIAFDGEEAILKVKAHEYDAVICDLMMPKLRGDGQGRGQHQLDVVVGRLLYSDRHIRSTYAVCGLGEYGTGSKVALAVQAL